MASTTEKIVLNLDLIENISPSIQRVYEVLFTSDQMTISDIKLSTKYSRRTVSFALRQLIAAGLVTRKPTLLDMRRYYYSVL